MGNEKKPGLDHLEEEINREILAASDEEILEDALDAGDDAQAFASRMQAWLRGAKEDAGKTRLQNARAELERDRQRSSATVVPMRKAPHGGRPKMLLPDTMAARHGKGLSERDKAALAEDFDELLDDAAWSKNEDDKDS